ncbi:3-sulfolactaldehyde dehydrogenase [Colletotrichum fructicola]|nr:3-sulfolactaldehyde dehydrogenase [Colletotrichum fructicola]
MHSTANSQDTNATYHRDALAKLNNNELFISDAFIGGKWVSKTKKFDVFEPASGTKLGQVSDCDVEDFRNAIESAHQAQANFFEGTTGTSRGALLRRWYDLILANQDDLEAGIPSNLIQVCPTKNRQAATELATNSLVRKISFTGSTGVGKMLAKLASGTLKKVSLELGGNAPFIVFDDADLDLAVEGAMFCKFRCSGQTCVCANRLYVQKRVAKDFTSKLVKKVSDLQVGQGLDPLTTQGPLVNKAAIEKVREHIHDATSKGAKVEVGGQPFQSPGFFFQPTVLSGVTQDMIVSKDETFGPLAPVFEFETEEDVLRLANDTEFGLAGYFFSRDISRAMRVAQKLQVGMVGVNTGKISAPEAPFGGVKESGYGREGSLYGLEEYQNIKSITIGNQDATAL